LTRRKQICKGKTCKRTSKIVFVVGGWQNNKLQIC
jgi:hypothetical protein